MYRIFGMDLFLSQFDAVNEILYGIYTDENLTESPSSELIMTYKDYHYLLLALIYTRIPLI